MEFDIWFVLLWFIASAFMFRHLKHRAKDDTDFMIAGAASFFWPVTLIVIAWRKLADT